HAIARHVGADVDVAQVREGWLAGCTHADHRAWLRITLAESGKFAGELPRQDAQVALHILCRHARGVAGIGPGANDTARLAGVGDLHHGAGGRAGYLFLHLRPSLLVGGAPWPKQAATASIARRVRLRD